MKDYASTIPKGWKMTTLGQVAEFQRGFDLPTQNRKKGKYPLIVSNGIDGFVHEYKVKGPGVVTGRSGTLGNVLFIKENYWPLNTTLWIKDFKNNDEKFIYYWLLKFPFEKFNAGTGVPTLNRNHIHEVDVIIPENKLEQYAIAGVLSSLDDKIELLREQNKTLEAIAQVIFKEWFVNFNYPGATGKMVHSELGEIPEGWIVGRLEEIVSKEKYSIVDGPFGTQMKIEEYQQSGIPIIEMSYLENSFIIKKFKHFLSMKKFDEVKRSCARGGDIIISKTGTLGLLGILPYNFDKAIIVSRIAKITPSKELHNRLYIYQLLNYLQSKKYWNRISSGSTMPIFNLTHIKEVKIAIPNIDLYSKYESVLSPIYDKVLNNQLQIQTLSALRDTVLPKLMKGEVRVNKY